MHCKKHQARRETEKWQNVNVTVKNEDRSLDLIPKNVLFVNDLCDLCDDSL